MIKASDMIGRAIVIRDGGREMGKVKDLVIDQPGRQVLGFVISEGFMRPTRIAPWPGVQIIGPDSVILTGLQSVVKSAEAPEIKQVIDAGTSIRGLRLQTTAGKDLGKIDDVYFNEVSGAVEGYELSGGLLEGHSFMPTPLSIELGKDVAFISPEIAGTITRLGGIRSTFQK